jgi:hypothetical protein
VVVNFRLLELGIYKCVAERHGRFHKHNCRTAIVGLGVKCKRE